MKTQGILSQNQDFEFDNKARKFWLFTRKDLKMFGIPGLFHHQEKYDAVCFISAFFLELVGLYLFYTFVYSSWITVILFFLADVVFSIGSHYFQRRKTIKEAEIDMLQKRIILPYLHFSEGKNTIEYFLDKFAGFIKFTRIWIIIWSALICIIAMFKATSFFIVFDDGSGSSFNPITVIVILLYVLIAFLHIRSTGYYFASLFYYHIINRQLIKHIHHKKFEARVQTIDFSKDLFVDPGSPFHNRIRDINNIPIFNETSTRKHKIYNEIDQDNKENKKINQKFLVHGILSDIDIECLVKDQNNANQELLFIICRYIQLVYQLSTNPKN